MKLYLKNQELVDFSVLLSEFKGKGKSGRALAKFNKILSERTEEYFTYEMEIVEKYAERDINGNVTDKWQKGSEIVGNSEIEELRTDEIVIDMLEFMTYLQSLIDGIYSNEDNLDMTKLTVMDNLLEKLEKLQGDVL